MPLNSRLYAIEPSCAKKENVDNVENILVTIRNGDKKIMQYFRITSSPPPRIRKWNQYSQFRSTSTKEIPIEKTWTSYISMCQVIKRSRSGGLIVLHICFCSLSNNSKWQPEAPAQTWKTVQAWRYGRFTETKSYFRRKKLHRMNQGSYRQGSCRRF